MLYKEGIMDVTNNSIKGKKYRFNASSKCFKTTLEFLYTGQIQRACSPLIACSPQATSQM
jgi:hypothetical protein